MQDDIVIVGAARTAVGAFNGALGALSAHELGKTAIKAALERAGIEPGRVRDTPPSTRSRWTAVAIDSHGHDIKDEP